MFQMKGSGDTSILKLDDDFVSEQYSNLTYFKSRD